ncbi:MULTISPECIES: glycosyltransferase family 9 protein [unclassified Brenneria]|uniref:glycosyltransferase family 9 protein n=1 Tax=unclassified Brenneria TaxID=2634434 RepID=UPI0029C53A8C|nr:MULTISPECIES: glycosyltransferase family 9 protein [unclassified Brenneria]MDX5629729.1 glycosyltransferase family 9 protein [Brenneria sp. L3-3Z]MDX5696875.1 glycosyltransferase family 9 protein [Brenneria sp. L4-2C]
MRAVLIGQKLKKAGGIQQRVLPKGDVLFPVKVINFTLWAVMLQCGGESQSIRDVKAGTTGNWEIMNRPQDKKIKNIKFKIKEMLFLTLSKAKKEPLDMKNVKSIGVLLFNVGLGDVIVATGIFRELKKHGYQVSVFVDAKSAFLFERNMNVENVIVVKRKGIIDNYKELYFDLLIDLYSRVDEHFNIRYLSVITKIKHRYCIGFDVKNTKVYNDNIIPASKEIHLTDAYASLLNHIGIHDADLSYDIYLPEEEKTQAKGFLAPYAHNRIVAFNPYASNDTRSFTSQQIDELLRLLQKNDDVIVIIIGEKNKIADIEERERVIKNPFESFWGAAAMVAYSDMVISVETSIVHLANALDKELVSVYSSEKFGGYESNFLFAPHYDKAVQLIAPNGAARNMNIDVVFSYVKIFLNSK